MISAISAIARSNGSEVRLVGVCTPLTLRTNCRAAASISAEVATGCKPRKVVMFRHISQTLVQPFLKKARVQMGHMCRPICQFGSLVCHSLPVAPVFGRFRCCCRLLSRNRQELAGIGRLSSIVVRSASPHR